MRCQTEHSSLAPSTEGNTLALDLITRALVAEFLSDADIKSTSESQDFEKFSTHIFVSPLIEGAPDYQVTSTASGNDTGLDTIAIVVNGELITEVEEIDLLVDANKTLDVQYVFAQTEIATSFSTSKIGQISYGVRDFFAAKPTLSRNESVTNVAEISQKIMKNARLFRSGNPTCTVYYNTGGRLQSDSDLEARRKAAQNEIDELSLFSQTAFTLVDARGAQARYRNLKNGIEREIEFRDRVPLPDIEGVAEAHLGFVAAPDIVRLLSGEDGELLSSIFYENVRDFQGLENAVNSEIAETLSTDRRSRFPLMNNGVTIIAKSVQQTGVRFVLHDFQIVNGCQTSNVIWRKRKELDPTVAVPLRLIATQNEDVIRDVIRATNRQTEVKSEQFLASTEYLKQVELFFASQPASRLLYLERRSKQFANAAVERTRVIPFNTLVRSFASTVLGEPHRVTKNYKQLLSRIPEEILSDEHKPALYFTAASSSYRLDYLFRNGILDRRFTPAKFHLLLASRLLAAPTLPKFLNSKEADKWSADLTAKYWDSTESEAIFSSAAQIIEKLAEGDLSRDRIRTLPFTEALLRHFKQPQKK